MNAVEWEVLLKARDAIASAPHGHKDDVVAQTARTLQCSVATLYRHLKKAGLDTGRTKRRDAGEAAITLDELRLISGVMFASRRDNDKQLWGIERVMDNLRATGRIATQLSPGRVMAKLREHDLHPEQLVQPRAAVPLASLHPNHVWQIDSSTSVLYKDKSGFMRAMHADTFYANKPEKWAAVVNSNGLVTRHLAVDHASGAFKGRYYLGGEKAETAVDFFIWAVSRQEKSVMHGVPTLLYTDQGPAFKSGDFANLMRSLKVDHRRHEPGRANATGSVEKHGDLWERGFEGGFKFMDPDTITLELLNSQAEEWAAAYCSSRPHSRHGQPRYSMWMHITNEQLRTVPEGVLRELATSKPVERRINNYMQLSFVPGAAYGSRDYNVSGLAGMAVGRKVLVTVNPFRAPAIDVRCIDPDTGEEFWSTVEPIVRNEFGFDVANSAVIGQEHRRARNTHVDEQRNGLLREAYRLGDGLPTLEEAEAARRRRAQAYAGIVDPMADVRATAVPTYLPRRGTELVTPATVKRELPRLSVMEICKRLKQRMGPEYRPEFYAWIFARFGEEGATEDQLAAIAAQLSAEFASPGAGQSGTLRIVGGGAA